ncbi:hypothetical protein CYMTET_38076 [Cymbomonas tetramitiformis]|uniref:Uncharacterized protein n=1 Tax=Cymbomonas tetramitiformis TaxID=36881 RepID=A0AAE0F5U1_9CHLO|nr:hypothetical protein CYMTET_38076 [Cymbomonas tetramitiformis]
MNQRTGTYTILKIMLIDTGSMLFVMNQNIVTLLGLVTTLGKASIDTILGSQGTQQHRQWGPGEMMLVICPGTTNEMVLADVTGISPCSNVNFDVLLSVDVLHAMAILTPMKAYTPIRTLKTKDHNNSSHFVATPSWNEPVTPSAQHRQAPPKARWNALFRVAWTAIVIASLLQPAAGALIEVDEANVSPMNTLPVASLLWDLVALLLSIGSIAFIRRRQARQPLPSTAVNAPPGATTATVPTAESPPPTPTSDTRNPMQE